MLKCQVASNRPNSAPKMHARLGRFFLEYCAGALWPDEAQRMAYLQQEITRGEIFYGITGMDFVVSVVDALLGKDCLTSKQVQAIWDQCQAVREKQLDLPASRRKRAQ